MFRNFFSQFTWKRYLKLLLFATLIYFVVEILKLPGGAQPTSVLSHVIYVISSVIETATTVLLFYFTFELKKILQKKYPNRAYFFTKLFQYLSFAIVLIISFILYYYHYVKK